MKFIFLVTKEAQFVNPLNLDNKFLLYATLEDINLLHQPGNLIHHICMRNIIERSFFARDTRRRGCNGEEQTNVPFFGHSSTNVLSLAVTERCKKGCTTKAPVRSSASRIMKQEEDVYDGRAEWTKRMLVGSRYNLFTPLPG